MHLAPLIRDLAVILSVAAVVTFLFRIIKQPVVLGYIIAGVLVGPYTPKVLSVTDLPNVKVWAELGIIFLMFTLGLEFSFRKLAKVGLPAGLAAAIEVSFMLFAGYQCGLLLGWTNLESVFLGCMLAISSTTIILKTLEELGLKQRRFAATIFGVLIIEDVVAVVMLVVLSSIAIKASFGGWELIAAVGKLGFVVAIWVLVGLLVVPRFIRSVGKIGNDEMLVVVSLGLCLSLVAVAASFNYSVALGAFIMGSILSESVAAHRIEELVKPLRDVFGAVFFVTVGMLIEPRILVENLGPIAAITATLMIGKVTALTFAALATGNQLADSLRTGFTMAQIGEFSFIIATLGETSGLLSPDIYPTIVAVSLVTTFTTPYMVRASERAAGIITHRFPPKAKAMVDGYHAWLERFQAEAASGLAIRRPMTKYGMNAIVVIAIFSIVGGFGMPYLRQVIQDDFFAALIAWAVTMTVAAPFIFAMSFTFQHVSKSAVEREIPGLPQQALDVVSRLLTIMLVGFLSIQFFVTWLAILLTVGALFVLYRVFGRQLGETYHWFEGQIQGDRADEDGLTGGSRTHQHLAPWNARLTELRLHPDSPLVGARVADTQVRETYGVNIVALQRGSRTISAPTADERLFPGDIVLVLGLDAQVDRLRPVIESPSVEEHTDDLTEFRLRQIVVRPASPLAGQTIRSSRMREEYGCLIVGVERTGERMLNPPPEFVLQPGDRVWIVGRFERFGELRALGSLVPTQVPSRI